MSQIIQVLQGGAFKLVVKARAGNLCNVSMVVYPFPSLADPP